MDAVEDRLELVPRVDRLLCFIECSCNNFGYGIFRMHSGSFQRVGDKLGLVHMLGLAAHDKPADLKSLHRVSGPSFRKQRQSVVSIAITVGCHENSEVSLVI